VVGNVEVCLSLAKMRGLLPEESRGARSLIDDGSIRTDGVGSSPIPEEKSNKLARDSSAAVNQVPFFFVVRASFVEPSTC
jgi:hypothetical protein